METIWTNLPELAAATIGVVMAVSNLLTMFIDESKVKGILKPIVAILNLFAGNVLKNKNATDNT